MKAHVLPIVLLTALVAGCASKPAAPKAKAKTDEATPYHRPITSLGAKFGALPPAVQSTVLAEAGGADITDAVRDVSSGRVVYKIYFHDPAIFPPLYVAHDGSVLNYDLTVAIPASHGTSVKPSDVPPAVMKVIEDKAPASGYSAINMEKWGTRTIYVVSFKDEAHFPKIFITADGTLVEEGQ
ncbi:MAG TPA: hypothetical protein VMU04_15715 [Candidatus Acidoferrum sp.]|nr:hypothetical protein [Candidatus Acidoferrum sp.]